MLELRFEGGDPLVRGVATLRGLVQLRLALGDAPLELGDPGCGVALLKLCLQRGNPLVCRVSGLNGLVQIRLALGDARLEFRDPGGGVALSPLKLLAADVNGLELRLEG